MKDRDVEMASNEVCVFFESTHQSSLGVISSITELSKSFEKNLVLKDMASRFRNLCSDFTTQLEKQVVGHRNLIEV